MVGTHLVGTMVFALIGYRKVSVAWLSVWFAALALVCATNRGATLAVVIPIAIAMLALGRYRLMLATVAVTVGIFAALLTFESAFGDFEEATDSMDRSGQRAPDR